jgi:hypothetical protein
MTNIEPLFQPLRPNEHDRKLRLLTEQAEATDPTNAGELTRMTISFPTSIANELKAEAYAKHLSVSAYLRLLFLMTRHNV